MCCQYFHNDISLSILLWSVMKLTHKRHKRSNKAHKSAKTSYLGYILSKFKTHYSECLACITCQGLIFQGPVKQTPRRNHKFGQPHFEESQY